MNSIMTEMLKKYQENGVTDKKNAVKEIMQDSIMIQLAAWDDLLCWHSLFQ